MDNDACVEDTIDLSGETKNCYVFEPDEGSDIVSKIYIRKGVFTGKPARITITIHED